MQPAESIPPPPKKSKPELDAELTELVERLTRAIEHGNASAQAPTKWVDLSKLFPVISLTLGALVSYYGAQSAMRDRIDQSVRELRSELKEVRTELRETFVSKDSIQELKSRMDQTAEGQRQLAASVAQLDKTISSFIAVQQAKR